jgi:polysaccharide biosynthesis/export protein
VTTSRNFTIAAHLSAALTLTTVLMGMLTGAPLANAQPDAGPKPEAPPLNPTTSSQDPLVRIGPGDLLQITVFDIPELTQTLRVGDRGDVSPELAGTLHVAGLTPTDAQALIEKTLKDRNLVRDPHVTVLITEYVTQGVSVVGQVQKPGVYPALGRRTLLDIVSEAGGITLSAAHEATIQRRMDGAVLHASLDDDPGALLASNVEIQPGDTVIVPKAGIVYVLGDVGRPGGFVIQSNGSVTLLQALALAGGVNRSAAYGKARVVRKLAAGFSAIAIDFKRIAAGKQVDMVLQPNDIVYIPPSVIKSALERTPEILQAAASSTAIYAMAP